jgi:hypothetical protein
MNGQAEARGCSIELPLGVANVGQDFFDENRGLFPRVMRPKPGIDHPP